MDDSTGGAYLIVWLFFAVLLGLIPAAIAQSKGREFVPWLFYGFFLFLIALVHSILLAPSQASIDQKAVALGNLKCPNCAEWIKREAKVCRFCGRDVEATAPAPTA